MRPNALASSKRQIILPVPTLLVSLVMARKKSKITSRVSKINSQGWKTVGKMNSKLNWKKRIQIFMMNLKFESVRLESKFGSALTFCTS